jgi:hypothetical protein
MLNVPLMAAGEAMPRHQIERYIDHLIDLLDALDGDCDIEEGGDLEPYLAGDDPVNNDREFDDEREWDQAESGIADEDGLAEQFAGLGFVRGVQ